jgi:hypothetical protein
MHEILTVLKRADFNAQDYPFYKFVYYHSWQLLELPGRKALVDISVFPPLVGGSINDVQNVSQVPASEFGSAMQTLVSMSLVDKIGKIEQERLALHPLTQYFIRSNITREWQET